MKLSLAANISRLRKENALTQEQLAEALGVTFASVSKWERDVATPELNLIAQMADLFGVSMDALVGFSVHNNSVAATEERIHNLQRKRCYDEAIDAAEKALLRYPNDFRMVYRAGQLYTCAGVEKTNRDYSRRGIALLEHAISLLSQNTDPKISEASLQSEIAECYLALGETEKGLSLLKQYNVYGVHNPLIALTYTTDIEPFDAKGVEPYLMNAFGDIIVSSIRTMSAYANYYKNLKNYAACRDSLLWLIDMLNSIKSNPDEAAYVDKLIAFCYAACASSSLQLGEEEMVEPYLRRSYRIAKAFDAAPTYQIMNIKFCVGDTSHAMAYDNLGESAMACVEHQLSQESDDAPVLAVWKKILEEGEGAVK